MYDSGMYRVILGVFLCESLHFITLLTDVFETFFSNTFFEMRFLSEPIYCYIYNIKCNKCKDYIFSSKKCYYREYRGIISLQIACKIYVRIASLSVRPFSCYLDGILE